MMSSRNVATTTVPSAQSNAQVPLSASDERAAVERTIHRRVEDCDYAFYLRQVTWQFDEGTLRLDGRVPTFDLQETLPALFQNISGVERIINEVQVISSTGLSSVRSSQS